MGALLQTIGDIAYGGCQEYGAGIGRDWEGLTLLIKWIDKVGLGGTDPLDKGVASSGLSFPVVLSEFP